MRPEPEVIPVLIDAAQALKGSQRRLFTARTVKAMGRGGQRWALEHLGWCRDTVRKGMHELCPSGGRVKSDPSAAGLRGWPAVVEGSSAALGEGRQERQGAAVAVGR